MSGAQDIEQMAANWLMRREEPEWNEIDAAALAVWLEESWDHKAAYWRLEYGWRAADRISALGLTEDDLLPAWRKSLKRISTLPVGLGMAASLAGLALIGAFQLGYVGSQSKPTATAFSTPTGGQEQIELADGSTVELNTASTIRSLVTPERRDIWVDKGEAFFHVRKNNGKPFVVHAGDRIITVLGTKFSVRLDDNKVTVSVLEGRVKVDSARPDTVGESAVVTGGGTAIADADSTLLIRSSGARVQKALAWREGMLVFDQAPLAQVAAEFNRYNRKQIVIQDTATAGTKIGGSFRADNTDAFLRLLRDAYGFQVKDDGQTAKVSD